MTKTIDEAIQGNTTQLSERGPALSYAYTSYVIARNPSEGIVLLGGLGSMGLGRMWTTEDPSMRDYPGYDDAEIVA